MAASLSAYWVKFFKGAGFPQDVATKHAVVFSNNRIKPDMLPDLDKPSLKEMGIALMGDMIAILRYAKKVVEETTCERFLVDSEDTACKISMKPILKKVGEDSGDKTVLSATSKINSKKIVKPLAVTAGKKAVVIKKSISVENTTNTVNQKQNPVKRKLRSEEPYKDNKDSWIVEKKRIKTMDGGNNNNNDDDDDDDDDDNNDNGNDNDIIKYAVAPKVSNMTSRMIKKTIEQKRTVFDRLGDSSVTSTTNVMDTVPTFNITGVGKDAFKRSSSVFKRLGDINDKKDHVTSAGILKNGSSITSSSGILKNRTSSNIRKSIIMTKRVVPKTTGTMHADHEASKKTFSNTNRILKLRKETMSDSSPTNDRIIKPTVTSGKLASERLVPISAKARLGTTTAKQVTFSKMATVARIKKADVFSRLGV